MAIELTDDGALHTRTSAELSALLRRHADTVDRLRQKIVSKK